MPIGRLDLYGNINEGMVARIGPILDYLATKKKYRAVLLAINSPGGAVTPSELLAKKIQRIGKSKPVYAVIQGIGASGAYWAAVSCNKIYASRTSIVGSVGIISMMPSVKGLLERIGVKIDIARIGDYKTLTSPFESRSEEELNHMTQLLGDLFEPFRSDVISKRNIPEDKVSSLINGDIFSASHALQNNLIDQIGDVEDAIREIMDTLHVKHKIRNLTPRPPLLNRMARVALNAVEDYL